MLTRTLCLIGLGLVLALPASSEAQVASSFDQLRLLVRAGDTITVRDARGMETTGKIGTLSSSSLELLASGSQHEFKEADVTSILQRRSDSLANGAKWGLLAGLGGAGTLFGVCGAIGDCEPNAADVAISLALWGAIGTGVGVGVDALITRRQMIFERQAGTARLSVAPVLSASRKGVALSIGF